MDDQNRQVLLELLTEQRIATLAVEIDGKPFASLVPFAATESLDATLIHVSQLAKHSAGLADGAAFSLLIHRPDCQPETNPAQLARVTLQGSVERLDPEGEPYGLERERYLEKFPKSASTVQLCDVARRAGISCGDA